MTATYQVDISGAIWRGISAPVVQTLHAQSWYSWPYWRIVFASCGALLVGLIILWFWTKFWR